MPEQSTVRSLITPLDQTLRAVFNAQRSYFIDIYQREYKWSPQNVSTLLNDIEVRFLQHKLPKHAPKEIQEDVLGRFEPYFLNTYLTSTTSQNTSIVDGQQRLTTLLLILIKLYHILQKIEALPDTKGKTFASKVVEQLIFETDDFGAAGRFKIHNDNREVAFRALVEGRPVDKTDQTRTRIAENFDVIDRYFETFLKGPDAGTYDLVRTTYYITYLLDRVSIVEIRIERQENVAMIFEVVNDRGMGLRPYEILKGKLIGGLPALQKEKANEVWSELQERYFRTEIKNSTEKTVDLDIFFQTFFRAKFADTETEYEKFDDETYHYEMYRNSKVKAYFGDYMDRSLLFERIVGDIRYFADLYLELRTSYKNEHLIFNKILDQNQQYLLLLSAITRDDKERAAKIDGVAAKFDQFHTLLRLLNAFDNSFQRSIYRLNPMLRDKSLADIKPCFDRELIATLVADGQLTEGQISRADELFDYERFKGVRNSATNFSKYVLMRVDRYLSRVLNKPSYASDEISSVEERFNKNNRQRYGMHLEHIYTQHPANKALFTKDGVFDEARFQQTRNMLGMVLLLKDKQNLSSNDEIYRDKCETYAQSNLVWNELLVGHIPGVDRRNLPETLRLDPVEPADNVFPLDAVESRQKAVFEAINLIWSKV